MHLTNYSINKFSKDFKFNQSTKNENTGHKRSMAQVFEMLAEKKHNIKKAKLEIKKLIIKTFCCAEPYLVHYYRPL